MEARVVDGVLWFDGGVMWIDGERERHTWHALEHLMAR
jgi:hypothetical protein